MLQSLPTTTVAPQAAVDRFEAIARKTVVAPLQNAQTGSVEAAAARTQLAASLSVTRTADAMMGTLLDTKA
ncbi:flagellar hook protein FlgE [Brevundimonas sp. GN22]